jgi:hypothetical protein
MLQKASTAPNSITADDLTTVINPSSVSCDNVGKGHVDRTEDSPIVQKAVKAHITIKADDLAARIDPGSDRGGERAAAIYTLIATAKLNGVDPQARLADVLRRIADHPAALLHELLPWNWKVEPVTLAA